MCWPWVIKFLLRHKNAFLRPFTTTPRFRTEFQAIIMKGKRLQCDIVSFWLTALFNAGKLFIHEKE